MMFKVASPPLEYFTNIFPLRIFVTLWERCACVSTDHSFTPSVSKCETTERNRQYLFVYQVYTFSRFHDSAVLDKQTSGLLRPVSTIRHFE